MKTILMATVIAGASMFSATEAAAQANEAAPDWSGLYVGAQAAYHFGDVDDSECEGLCADDTSVEDGYLAIQAGYDAEVGENMVVGVMGWIGVTPVEQVTQLTPTITVRGETDFAGFVGARAGLNAGSLMPYAFAGYLHVSGTVTNEAAPIKENERSHDGFGLGVGAEYRIARHFSIDGRYMYSDLGDEEYDFGGGPTPYGEQAHTLSLAVNFRF
jgi:outer membrane immunogenic protein